MRVPLAVTGSILFLATGCFAEVRRAGHSRTESREVPPFDSVAVAAGIHATVSIGARKPVEIDADDDVLPLVETKVEDGQLRIGFKPHFGLWGLHDVHVVLQTPQLHGIAASGGSDVRAQLTPADEIEISASGGSDVHATGAEAGTLSLRGSGGAVIDVAGHADQVDIQMSGGTHVKASGLSVKNVHVQGSGGSEAELRASGRIRGGLSGGSELHIRGNASSRVATSGGSTVEIED
jgi:hypothetical protein